MKTPVCVIFGGRSGEHEVSVTSAESVINALDKSKYEIRTIAITKSGRWIPDISCMEYRNRSLEGTELFDDENRPAFRIEMLLTAGDKQKEVIFPVLHGPFGEDGTIQGLLEMAELPYVGSGVLGSAIAMDKAISKLICLAKGIPVADFYVITKNDYISNSENEISNLENKTGYPCFIKPANLGSSIGISKAWKRNDLIESIDIAFAYDKKIIAEKAIDCREIEVSVLGNSKPEASIAGEIITCNEFYDYKAKYVDNRSKLVIPADLPADNMNEVRSIAIEAFKAFDCAGMARADFFIDRRTGKVYFNEINTIPGFTSISMYPKLWEASGLPYTKLLDRLISLAIERFEEACGIHRHILQPQQKEGR